MQHLEDLLAPTRTIATPFLVIDEPVLSGNVTRMQQHCDARGVLLRPHIKTHKSSEIVRMQLDAGAVGVTCATLSEAVALGDARCPTDVYVSTPIFFDSTKRDLLQRAVALHEQVTLTADSVEIARSIVDMTPDSVAVRVEVESGLERTGAAPALVAPVVELLGERFAGFATHGGHSYRPGAAENAASDERAALAGARAAIGDPTAVASAGSTPTAPYLGDPVAEIRPGTYVFGDHQQVSLGACVEGEVAAAVVATVIHSSDERFVIDAGAKAITKDRPGWLESFGRIVGRPDAVIDRLNDNHGMVTGSGRPAVGDRVVVVPNHICPVVDLFDEMHLVSGQMVRTIRVDLRGAVT